MGRPPRISREQILDAARRAFAERGFDSTTLADIAGGLKVTPAAILRHFKSKQALFTAAMSARDLMLPQPVIELAGLEGSEDPRIVLRRFAEQFIPFMQSVIGAAIAVQMHMRARQTTFVVPFDTSADDTLPRRGLRILAAYFQRAMDAKVIRKSDPRALALLFVGHLQSYVLIHEVLRVEPVYPLDRYLDALIDLWVGGAILGVADAEEDRPGRRRPRRSGGGAAVHAQTAAAETARPGRDRGGADGERRVAGRRPRGSRPRR